MSSLSILLKYSLWSLEIRTFLKFWVHFFPTIFFTWSLGMSVLPQLLMHFMGTRLQFSKCVWKKWNIYLICQGGKNIITMVWFGLKILLLDLLKKLPPMVILLEHAAVPDYSFCYRHKKNFIIRVFLRGGVVLKKDTC